VTEDDLLEVVEECVDNPGKFSIEKVSLMKEHIINVLLNQGQKLIHERYNKLLLFTGNRVKYYAICEGYLKGLMGFKRNDDWDYIHEMIEEEAERSLLIGEISLKFDEEERVEKILEYEEDNENPDGDDFSFLRDLEAFKILSIAVERAEDMKRSYNYLATERMLEFNEEIRMNEMYESVCKREYMAIVLWQEMQIMKDEMVVSISVEEYELFWIEEGKKISRRDILFEKMQRMTSSMKDFKVQFKFWDCYEEKVIEFYDEQNNIRKKWEDVFACDNGFVFDRETWLKLLKMNPTILINGKWEKISKCKKWKNYFWNRAVCLKFSDWNKLWGIADLISFMTNIDSSRNDEIYLEMLKRFKLDGKVKKMKNWLKEVRKNCFIKKAINQKPPIISSRIS
jgi:hypothetical protein